MSSEKFPCEWCGRVFNRNIGRNTHMNLHCKKKPKEVIVKDLQREIEAETQSVSAPTSAPEPMPAPPAPVTSEAWEWEKPDALALPPCMENDGYRYRWLSQDMIDQKGWRKWELVKPEDIPKDAISEFKRGSPTDARVMRGHELMLARMPEGLALAREAYQKKKSKAQMDAVKTAMRDAIGPHGHDDVTFQKERTRPIARNE